MGSDRCVCRYIDEEGWNHGGIPWNLLWQRLGSACLNPQVGQAFVLLNNPTISVDESFVTPQCLLRGKWASSNPLNEHKVQGLCCLEDDCCWFLVLLVC